MIRRLLRRLAEWVAADPSPERDEVRVLVDPARYVPTCEVNASCEPGDHSYSWPCEYAWGEPPWDADDLPSTADPSTERALTARRRRRSGATLAAMTATPECQACQRYEKQLADARAEGDQAREARVLVQWRHHDVLAGHVARRG